MHDGDLLDRVHVRRLLVAGRGVDEHDADGCAVLGAGEHVAAVGVRQRLAGAHAQVVPRLLQVVFDRLAVEPRLGCGWDPVRAQRVQHGMVVAVTRGEVEHEFGRDPEPGHARVVDGAAERVVPASVARALSSIRGNQA